MTTPTDVTYVASTTAISSAHMNGINDWVFGAYTLCGETFTATAFRTALSAAKSGANTDITSLTGITGAVSVVDPSGSIGYGVGSGDVVTQLTSKSTGVTLNTPSGQITMHNAVLAAGASVVFMLTNSTITYTDYVPPPSPVGFGNYRVEGAGQSLGAAEFRVTNVSAGALSEAVVLNFVVIKGSAS